MKTAENILTEADRLTSKDRQQAYGHPLDDYNCTAAIWTAMLKHAGLIPKDIFYQISAELAQAMMIALKLVRLSQNLEHRDSLVDIAGYARTIEMTIEERSRRWAKEMNEAGETPDYPGSGDEILSGDRLRTTRFETDEPGQKYIITGTTLKVPSCDGVHRGSPCIDPRCHIWVAMQEESKIVVNQVNEDATASEEGAS